MGLFDEPYVDEDAPARCSATPAHREVARRGRALGGAAAQRGELLPLRRPAAGLDRRDRPARRLQARHARARGASTSTSTRRSPSSRASGARWATRCRSSTRRASARRSGLPVDVRHVRRQRAGGPEGFDDEAELGGRSTWRGTPTSQSWWLGEWQNMIGERRRGRRWSCRAASSSCCRRWSRPARRSCCWS